MFHPLDDGNFIWASERTGFNHFYLYHSDGNLIRQLTSGDWQVDSLAGVDQNRGLIYFTGSKDGPTERHLYKVSMEDGQIERLTPEPGTHIVALDHGFNKFVDVFSDTNTPPPSRSGRSTTARPSTPYTRPTTPAWKP